MSTIVVTVGNGGGNVVDDFRKTRTETPGVEYLYLDQDHEQLECHGNGDERKVILEKSCKTLGENFADNYDTVVLVVCLGGFTGNYYADAIAEELRGHCRKLLCIASLPFEFEGRVKRINAVAALGNIKRWCDLTAIQDNNCLPGDIDFSDLNDSMANLLCILRPLTHDENVSESVVCCEWATVKQIRVIWQCAYREACPTFLPNGVITFHQNRENKDGDEK